MRCALKLAYKWPNSRQEALFSDALTTLHWQQFNDIDEFLLDIEHVNQITTKISISLTFCHLLENSVSSYSGLANSSPPASVRV